MMFCRFKQEKLEIRGKLDAESSYTCVSSRRTFITISD
jgi:hypothetical protein